MLARLLWLGALTFGAGGLALRLAPPAVAFPPDAAPPPPPPSPPTPGRAVPADAGRYAPVVEANIFSQARVAPAKRFSPDAEEDSAPPPKPRAAPAPPPIRLFGITRSTGGAIAIIEADPKVRGAELYRVGDRLAGGSIASITDSSVIIARPGGALTLRLPESLRRRP